MTRIEMVRRLLSEGLSRNTLINATDKQLLALCERMLNEEVTKQVKVYSMNNPKDAEVINTIINDPKKVTDIAKQGHIQVTKEEKTKPTTKQLTALDKNKNGKIDKEDFKMLRSKKEVKEELKGGQTKLDANKNGKIDKEDFKLLKKKTPTTKTKMKEGVEVKNWVKGLAEEKYHPFTSKNEILNLIKTKLHEVETASIPMPSTRAKKGHNGVPEFMTYDSITSSAPAEAPTKPTTAPTTTPKPKKPFNPGPKENPGPSANTTTKPITKPTTTPTPTKPKKPFNPGPKENPGPSAGIR
jgi:hypothetical protein